MIFLLPGSVLSEVDLKLRVFGHNNPGDLFLTGMAVAADIFLDFVQLIVILDSVSHFLGVRLFPYAGTAGLQPWRAEDFRGTDSQLSSPFRHNPEGTGKSSGRGPSTLARWERGKSQPTKGHMAKLTTFLAPSPCTLGSFGFGPDST